MLLIKIKNDQLDARKERDAIRASLLTTLYAEAVKVGKDDGNRDTRNEEVVATVRKFLKSNAEAQKVITDNEALSVLQLEQKYLEAYLPPQLTENDINLRIELLMEDGIKDMKNIMASFKVNYPGRYDGALLSKLVKEALNGS